MKKKLCNLYIYKLFFEINPNTLSTGDGGLGVGVGVGVASYSRRRGGFNF